MEKISFIIPAYNCEKYINNCIHSIVNQNKIEQYDVEIIIINDGSTDGTEKEIFRNLQKDKRIKYIYQENSGAPIARNNGIKSATGDWLVFLDSDDELNAGYFEHLDFKEIKEEKCDLIIGNYKEIDESGKEIKDVIEYSERKYIEGNGIFELCVNDPKPGTKIYSADIIRNNQLIFDELAIGQDANFFIKYLAVCRKVLVKREYFYKYRLVEGSISHTYTLKNLKIIDTFRKIKEFYKGVNKIDIYNRYIVYAEAQHYYFQFCKLRLFENNLDRKIIYYTFKKLYKELNIDARKCFSNRNKMYLQKFKLRLFMGCIFTSSLNSNFYKLKRKRKKRK